MRTFKVLSALGAMAVLVAGACSPSHDAPPHGDAGRFAFQQIEERAQAAVMLRPYRDISELLPNVLYERPGGKPEPIVAAVVVGHITAVTPGRAHVFGESGRREVAFDQPAMARTLHLHVAVDEQIGSGDVPDRVTVGLAICGSTDPARMARSLEGAGRLLLFLDQPGPVFDYEPGLFSLAEGGYLIATIAKDGQLALPAVEGDWPEVKGDLRTLDDVRRAAQQLKRTIPLTRAGERAEDVSGG
jgi:hypothetical protein